MSNTSDSSTVDTPSNGSRFGRGFTIRIAAVALFLGLGTFAVSQALKSKGNHDGHDHAAETSGVSNDEPMDDGNPDDGDDNKLAFDSSNPADSEQPSSDSSFQNPLGDAPKVETFSRPGFQPNSLGAADRRPAVAPSNSKNLVAKPAVTPQDFQGSGNRLSVNPNAFQQDDSNNVATTPVGQTAEKPEENKTLDLGNSFADKSRDLLNKQPQGLSNLRDRQQQPVAQQPSSRTPSTSPRTTFPAVTNLNNSPGNSTGFAANPSTEPQQDNDNKFALPPIRPPAVTQENTTTPAVVNSDQRLAPLNGPGGLRNTDQAKSSLDSPTQNLGNPPQNLGNPRQNLGPAPSQTAGPFTGSQSQVPSRPLNENFNIQPRSTGGFQNNANQQSAQTQTPRTNQGFNNQPRQNPVDLGARNNTFNQPQQQQPPTSIPVIQRNAVPVRNASSVRAMAPSALGGGTLPTPGEKTLEGTRSPSLTVQRIAPREIQLNTPATFEIIVRNVGKIEANDVRVYDQIPTGTQLLEASPQPSRDASGAIQWDMGNMAPGQERRIKMKLKATQPGEIGSVARVTFGTRSSVRTLVTKPVLEITHSAPSKSLIGDKVPLDIVVTNKGNGAAKQVIIQEDIPRQLEYSDGFRQIEYEVGTLAPGQSRKLQLVLKAADVGKLRNIISANGAGGLTAQHAVDMEVVAPKLAANASGPRRRYLRRQATHEFQVQNNGTATATNVELMAKLPQGLKYVSSNNRGQYDPATNAVYWSLAELDAGITATVSLDTVPVATGDQSIAFNAVADLKQKATADAELVVEHLVDVFFDIDDVVDHIEIGADTKYQLRVVNQGTKTATNIRLQLDLPPGLRPTNVEGGLQSQIQGQRVIFAPITSMNPGDEIKVEVTAAGVTAGEHKIVASMQSDGRQTPISKEETTQVYSDR